MFKSLTDSYTLNNGVTIPCVGFGTFRAPDGEVAAEAVRVALEAGYRHVDTAAVYGNEASVGEGLRRSGIDRKDVFLTSKLANDVRGYDAAKAAFDGTLAKLGTDYLDMYLIHWPNPKQWRPDWEKWNAETWRAMEDMYKEGRIRAIGVSNFVPHHLEALAKTQTVVPAVNQIRLCPGDTHAPTIDYCRAHNIVLEAYTPLGNGKHLTLPEIIAIADKYGKTPAQVLIVWSLMKGFLPLPKSVTPERIRSNTELFDFCLTEAEVDVISALQVEGLGWRDPDA